MELFLNTIPEHVNALTPYWHACFKFCLMVAVGLLPSQPFTNSHFQFLITVASGQDVT
jgi:hypothetical protein